MLTILYDQRHRARFAMAGTFLLREQTASAPRRRFSSPSMIFAMKRL